MWRDFDTVRTVLPYVLMAIFACGSLAACFLLLRALKSLQKKLVRQEEDLKSATSTWANSLSALGKQMEVMEDAARHPSADGNAAIRRKVLKMHRLGGSVEQIARALRLSKGEVMLLLKVHTIILRPFEKSSAEGHRPLMEQKA